MTPPTTITAPKSGAYLTVPLEAYGSLSAREHIVDRASALALNAALVTERPLLLRGDPGTGKSQLAHAAAALLQRRLLVHAVDSRTETRDLLYTVDAVSRLAQAQLVGALRQSKKTAAAEVDVMRFVQPGPLWWAFDASDAQAQMKASGLSAQSERESEDARAVVLLVDEIDKADPSVPNGLLDAFGSGCFSVEGRKTVTAKAPRPLVILTTNEDRALPDAFVRRCLVHHLTLPSEQAPFVADLVRRGKANCRGIDDNVLTATAELIFESRAALRSQGTCLPGVAEYIDLLHAVNMLAEGAANQIALLDEIHQLATKKHPSEAVG